MEDGKWQYSDPTGTSFFYHLGWVLKAWHWAGLFYPSLKSLDIIFYNITYFQNMDFQCSNFEYI
ncbi:hypothetical protein CUMW_164410 [Citrus unshiu]|uniref:Uncharacterized protein n=1 Tax=Citrus unshiu TaxID=55188 RepID=A0A2H5PSZ4_CITUN|nr:hypothetical protein CUMW_164410 [Citrus unshiu]